MKKIALLLVLCAQYLIGNAQAPDWQWAKQMAGIFSKGQAADLFETKKVIILR